MDRAAALVYAGSCCHHRVICARPLCRQLLSHMRGLLARKALQGLPCLRFSARRADDQSHHAPFVDGPQCSAEDIEGNWRAAVCADARAARTELVARRSGHERRSDRICMTKLTIFEVSGFACDALKADGPSPLPMCVCVRARLCVCVCAAPKEQAPGILSFALPEGMCFDALRAFLTRGLSCTNVSAKTKMYCTPRHHASMSNIIQKQSC